MSLLSTFISSLPKTAKHKLAELAQMPLSSLYIYARSGTTTGRWPTAEAAARIEVGCLALTTLDTAKPPLRGDLCPTCHECPYFKFHTKGMI